MLRQAHRLGSRFLLEEDGSRLITLVHDVAADDATSFPSGATQAISIAEGLALTHVQWHAHLGLILEVLHVLVVVCRLQLLLLRQKLLL